jgi:acyl-coenzyme A thioesterase PaaI-like protein
MRTPLLNPYESLEGYCCFGCAPDNPVGLKFKFFLEGDEVVVDWMPDGRYCGFNGVLHGGIQATAHDEIAAWVVYVVAKTSGFTRSLKVDYLTPVLVAKGAISLRGTLERMDGNVAVVRTSLRDGAGRECSVATAEYFTVPEHIARRKFAYPGYDAFFAPPRS